MIHSNTVYTPVVFRDVRNKFQNLSGDIDSVTRMVLYYGNISIVTGKIEGM